MKPGVAWRVLRAEGAGGFRERLLDRLAEARRRHSFRPVALDDIPRLPYPVLNLLATPPAPRYGGLQVQLLRRLEAEARHRPVALLTPGEGRDGWRLEIRHRDDCRAARIPGPPPSPVPLRDSGFESVVREALARTGAPALHVEGLAGLPLGSLLNFPLILSLHDFAAFCPRPHLLERPFERFCHYSRDLARCGRCLRHDWPVEDAFQGERRELARELLERALAVLYPSDFLRRTHFELFPGLEGTHRVVEPPAGDTAPLPPRPPGPLRHVACAGSVQPHKGARVFEEVVRAFAGAGLRWTVYGGGDAEILHRLRRLPGVKVRGYYRGGTLARRLAEDRVDLALLLSTLPETFSLVLSECWTAGVPALAFDHGAIGDRIRAFGGGRLVPPEAGAEGMVAVLGEIRRGSPPAVPAAAVASLPDARSAAAACLDLYSL